MKGQWHEWGPNGTYRGQGKDVPYLTIADFNRDEQPDIALILMPDDPTREYIIAVFHKDEDQYKSFVISNNSVNPDGLYLEVSEEPKKYAPCVYIGAYETDGSAYCFNKGSYWISGGYDDPNILYPLAK